MSDEERNAQQAGASAASASAPVEAYPDEHTTEPHANHEPVADSPAADGRWQMPKPKIQQTSGYLPQGYLKDMEAAAEASKAAAGSEDTTQEQPAFAGSASIHDDAVSGPVDIEPQPDVEQFVDENPPNRAIAHSSASAAKKSPFPMILAGLVGILLFIVVFLGLVYYFFLSKPAGGNNF